LTSPEIGGIAVDSVLSFKYWRQVESYSGSYDRTMVEISADGGTTWSAVWSKDSSNPSAALWMDSGAISLAGFADQSIIIRFTFNTVDSVANAYKGWYIDNVKVQ